MGGLAVHPDHNPAMEMLEYLKTGFRNNSKDMVLDMEKAKRDSPTFRQAHMVLRA